MTAKLANKVAIVTGGARGQGEATARLFVEEGARVVVNTPFANVANKPSEELKKDYLDQPIQRIGEPEEIARTNLFLASDDASYLCGAEIAVDGGQSLGVYRDFLPGGPRS